MVASSARTEKNTVFSGFNPLHCGAVVASAQREVAARAEAEGFNPLHCGAVVASPGRRRTAERRAGFQSPSLRGSGRFMPRISTSRRAGGVSIPFIAGQWSLREESHMPRISTMFQSPSLRGSGRFTSRTDGGSSSVMRFQSPSLRGSGRFPPRRGGASRLHFVSIPFIAGQWSLLAGGKARPPGSGGFQSPSLRGSGRFQLDYFHDPTPCPFQSPSLRGSGRFSAAGSPHGRRGSGFNPLHCGAVVASRA